MDYKAQIQHLKNKNLIIEDENFAIHILSKIGYYGLINGYKEVFKDSTTSRYIPDTTFDDIYQMYLFDATLREVFLKYILIDKNNNENSKNRKFKKDIWKKCISADKTSFIIVPRCSSLGINH